MTKHEPLVIGQIVYVESINMYSDKGRSIDAFEIVEANQSSAYAVRADSMDTLKPLKQRINQRTLEMNGYGIGFSYKVWLSEEAFHRDVETVKKTNLAKAEALKIVKNLELNDLELLIQQFGQKKGR